MRGFPAAAGGLAQLKITPDSGKIRQKNAVGSEHAPDFSKQRAATGGTIEIEQAENTEHRIEAFVTKTEAQKIALHQGRPRINKAFFCANVKHWPALVHAHTGLVRREGDFRQHGTGAAACLQHATRRRQQFVEYLLNQAGPCRVVDQIIEIVVERRKGVVELAQVLRLSAGRIGHDQGELPTGRRGGKSGRAEGRPMVRGRLVKLVKNA